MKIKIWKLQAASYFALLLPSVLFILGWVRTIIAIPMVLALFAAYFFIVRHAIKKYDAVFEMDKKSIITVAVLMLVWCYISGHGGFFYQSNDHHWRNAIFRDLINLDWPVIYERSDTSLVYYIGFWLVPALFGKISALFTTAETAWLVANIAMFIWSFIFLFLISLLVCYCTKSVTFKKVLLANLILIFFSGMDILGILITKSWDVTAVPNHLEWWAVEYQYSSNSTQLFWVFNQSTPAWLATALFLAEKDVKNFVFLCLSILACSPFPLVGLFLLLLCVGIQFMLRSIREDRFKDFLKDAFSPQNLIATVVILPVFYLYYKGNVAIETTGFRFFMGNMKYGEINVLIRYILFCILEFAFLALMLYDKNRKKPLYWFTIISLFVLGAFRMGTAADFAMRATIPALFVLMVFTIRHFNDNIYIHKAKVRYLCLKKSSITIIAVLLIGTVTPLTECFRAFNAVYKTGKIDLKADRIVTFSDKPVKDYKNFMAEHYQETNFYQYLQKKK